MRHLIVALRRRWTLFRVPHVSEAWAQQLTREGVQQIEEEARILRRAIGADDDPRAVVPTQPDRVVRATRPPVARWGSPFEWLIVVGALLWLAGILPLAIGVVLGAWLGR